MMLFRKNKSGKNGEKYDSKKEMREFLRRPANTAFKQQRLKAWQPILTPKTVIPTFFIIGIIFAPLGGILYWGSTKVNEFTIDYTNCDTDAPTDGIFSPLSNSDWSYHLSGSYSSPSSPTWTFANNTGQTNATVGQEESCTVQFDLPKALDPPVFMYYKLTNYYQNHRRYVRSEDSDQLKGNAVSYSTIQGGTCKPVDVEPGTGLPYYPCGLIANSVFNDTYNLPQLITPSGGNSEIITYNMTDSGIAWSGEAKKYQKSSYANNQVVPPPNWALKYPDGYTDSNPIPDLSQDEHFQVWMRTAGLPTFRKLYYRNDNEVMQQGRYEIQIFLNYPVARFHGTKSLVFSTVSFIGGRNPFLGIAYMATGGASILIGIFLTVVHFIRPRKLGDMSYLSWNQPDKKGDR